MMNRPITNEEHDRYAATDAARDEKNLYAEERKNFVDGAMWAFRHPGMDILEFIFYTNANFTRYTFFSKELWRKVKGFKDYDKCDVHAAFLHWWLEGEFGLKRFPVGCAWFSSFDSEQFHENYLEKYRPLFDAYQDWCYKQR